MVAAEFRSLVKPDLKYGYDGYGNEYAYYVDDFITGLTGIANEMLDTAPPVEYVLPGFVDFIGDDVLAGQNVNFDINFLYDGLMSNSNYKLRNDFVDLMRLTRKILPDLENHKLETVASNFKIEVVGSHRASADC